MSTNVYNLLAAAVTELELGLPTDTVVKLVDYLRLLDKWNQVHNLVAKSSLETMLIRHLLDSLVVAPYVVGPKVLDYGTGAGLPGIPLALALPSCSFTLVDSVAKKMVFLQQVLFRLELKNVKIIKGRVEKIQFDDLFDTIVTRATDPMKKVVARAWKLSKVGGQLLLMKGKYPVVELKEVEETCEVLPLSVPGLSEERHLVRLIKVK
jgi:16S rRNA (guanine(527)-N(7))-methyltransferase GidB